VFGESFDCLNTSTLHVRPPSYILSHSFHKQTPTNLNGDLVMGQDALQLGCRFLTSRPSAKIPALASLPHSETLERCRC